MDLSDALNLLIGLVFVFLVMSLTLSALTELIEAFWRKRGTMLFEAVAELMSSPQEAAAAPARRLWPRRNTAGASVITKGLDAARVIYEHPLIHGTYVGSFDHAKAARTLPSYLPTRHFSMALIDHVLAGKLNAAPTVASLPAYAPAVEQLRLAAERVDNPQLREAMQQALRMGAQDVEQVAKHLGEWFDAAMQRLSGRFTRRSHQYLFWIGLGAAVVLNVNTLVLTDALYKSSAMRKVVVAEAEQMVQRGQGNQLDQAVGTLQKLGLPIGWDKRGCDAVKELWRSVAGLDGGMTILAGLLVVLGYLLTALATSLGAPFWFDLLNRLVTIRSTIKPKEAPLPVAAGGNGGGAEAPPAPPVLPVSVGAAGAAAVLFTIDSDIFASLPTLDDKLMEDWQ